MTDVPRPSARGVPPSHAAPRRDRSRRASREDLAGEAERTPQIERETEETTMRLRIVEIVLARERPAVGCDRVRVERGHIDGVAAGDKGPVGIEGRDVSVVRGHVLEIAAQ